MRETEKTLNLSICSILIIHIKKKAWQKHAAVRHELFPWGLKRQPFHFYERIMNSSALKPKVFRNE